MKKYLPSILAAVVATAGIFSPLFQSWVATHPTVSLVAGSVSVILAHLLPSPMQPPQSK